MNSFYFYDMKKMLMFLAALMLCIAPATGKGLKGKLIYVNPGHGGWTANDRPLATINHPEMDTLSFFETSSNLWKAQELRSRLRRYGAKVVMSRTRNGYVTKGQKNATSRDKEETWHDEYGQQQIVGLEEIAKQVDSLNPDYFIAMHSNSCDKDGIPVNYLVFMYRGETGKEYAPGSIDRGLKAFPIVWDNPLTVWTSSSPKDPYVAGDITWMGGTPPGKANSIGYKGYLQVLKHHVPCYLVEGSFHSYQPERQRLLNRDYCRMEGVRYFRAINSFFNGKPEKIGYIAGTIKDADEKMNNPLYIYKEGTDDQWKPINYAMVYLIDKRGVKIRAYRTDDDWNGFFGFFDVEPGNYSLRYEAYGYDPVTENITVTADKTTYVKPRIHKKH